MIFVLVLLANIALILLARSFVSLARLYSFVLCSHNFVISFVHSFSLVRILHIVIDLNVV